jgi:hypothetical protein
MYVYTSIYEKYIGRLFNEAVPSAEVIKRQLRLYDIYEK